MNLNQKSLIDFCTKHDITVTGYSPLGQPGNKSGISNSLDHPKIEELAKKYNKTTAQIALRHVVSDYANFFFNEPILNTTAIILNNNNDYDLL